jgi:chloramphenicol 3-O phosphotransferase
MPRRENIRMSKGNIIFLNGTACSGKSTIAKALQETLDGFYLHTGIDHYLENLPEKFNVFSDDLDPQTAEGVLWVMTNNQQVIEVRIGPAGFRIIKGMYRAIAAIAEAGNDLIVDDALFERRSLREAVHTLYTFDVMFVGVRCPLEVAEFREQERGNPARGLARAHFALVHAHGLYDLEVDTSVSSPEECALQIKQRLQRGPEPSAFRQLRDTWVSL